jgi:hypothetical protein
MKKEELTKFVSRKAAVNQKFAGQTILMERPLERATIFDGVRRQAFERLLPHFSYSRDGHWSFC